jgi:hypothetical protein
METWVFGSYKALRCIERLAPDPNTQATPPLEMSNFVAALAFAVAWTVMTSPALGILANSEPKQDSWPAWLKFLGRPRNALIIRRAIVYGLLAGSLAMIQWNHVGTTVLVGLATGGLSIVLLAKLLPKRT